MKSENEEMPNGTDGIHMTDLQDTTHKLSFCYAPDPNGYALKPALATGWEHVLAERMRQMEHEGWSRQLDDSYVKWELRRAAESYAPTPLMRCVDNNGIPRRWPWDVCWWKPSKDRTRDLAMAGALYLAESARVRRLGHHNSAIILRNRAIACGRIIDRVLYRKVLEKAGPLERGKVSVRNFRNFFEKYRGVRVGPGDKC